MDEPAEKINVKVNSPKSKPAVDTTAVAGERLDSAMTEAINAIEITDDGKLTNVAKKPEVEPTKETEPVAGTPTAAESELPKFGSLQPKIDEHPLFSGVKDPGLKSSPKKNLLKRAFAPLAALLLVIIVGYLLIDSGVVKGASHLPLHIFKQPTVATAPVINPAITSSSTCVSSGTTQQCQLPASSAYTGWKTYCSSVSKECFKYPSDWKVGTDSSKPDLASITYTSGNSTAALQYINPFSNPEGGQGSFYIASINSLNSGDPNLKVLGGYYTANNVPMYQLVDNGFIVRNQLVVGKSFTIDSTPGYTNKNSVKGELTAYFQPPKTPVDTTLANSWLSGSLGQDCLKILQSFSYQ